MSKDDLEATREIQQEQEHERRLEEQEAHNRARWRAQLDKELKILADDPAYHEWLKSLEIKHDHNGS